MEQTQQVFDISLEVIEDHGMNYAGQTIDDCLTGIDKDDVLQKTLTLHELDKDKIKINHIGLWRDS